MEYIFFSYLIYFENNPISQFKLLPRENWDIAYNVRKIRWLLQL